ncbi:MAG: aspartate aminotransferase family protein [Candidatus Methanomethylicia archaeon]
MVICLSSKELAEFICEHTYGLWRPQKAWRKPIYITDAEGVYLYDDTGKQYLDFSSQLMCSNLGHKNKALINAIIEQTQKLQYISPMFACEIRAKATESLLKVMPENLRKIFYSTSGSEANETAVRIVRLYNASKGKYKIISRYSSYHGTTAAANTLTGDWRRWFAEHVSTIPGVVYAPDAYCYRCSFKLKHPECGIQCAEYVDYIIKNEGNVAAVIVEPVVGTNGVIVPPKEYLPRLREITDENDVFLIADEVMCGWGRTGKMFAIEHWSVKPDILTTAKGCTGAYMPLGITATNSRIAEYFEENIFVHGHTYTAHPITLAPLPVAIEEYRRLIDSGHVQRVGSYLASRLSELWENHKCIGDIRGLGLFWAIEIVKNRRTKKPFNTKMDKASMKQLMVDKISNELMMRGVYLYGVVSHFIIAPPLIINEQQIDEGIDALDEALKIADKEVEE